MRYLFSFIFITGIIHFLQAQKLNSAEEQIFKAEATKVIQDYYAKLPDIINHLKDSVTVKTDNEEADEEDVKITAKQQFIDYFFDNNDIYVYNDLSPDDKPDPSTQRVMTIDDYLDQLKTIYGNSKKEPLKTSLKSANVLQVGYNSQAIEKFYYAKIEVERKLIGMYLGKHYTENVKKLDFYVKTLDKPDTRLKKFIIIGIDFQSKQVNTGNLTVDEALAKGMRLFDEMDYDKAFQFLTKHANDKKLQKNSNATWALGYMYFWGKGTEKNDKEMVKWLELSAKKNNVYALYWLGENYYFGEYGVEEDEKKAFKYIKESARKGYSEAQFWLGERFQKGEGIRQSKNAAEKWYKKAAAQGHVKAQYALKALK